MDALGEHLYRRLVRLQADRVNFNNTWERIARVVLPTSVGFTTKYSPGTNLNQDIYDSTAQLALPRFAAAIDTLVTPQTSRWQSLVPKDKTRRSNRDDQIFCSNLTDLLFSVRYSPRANFASRVHEVYTSIGAFGNGVLYIHDARPGIRYMSVHLSEVWFDENAYGVIDTAFWVHEYTARQAVQRWGDKLPEHIRECAGKTPDKKHQFCVAVYPREERDPRKKDNKNMPFASVTFLADKTCEVVEESGYRTFPFAIGRDMTAPREVYARGPAQNALADILTLQEMDKTGLRFGQLSVDGPWLTADVDAMDPFAARPGAINAGYLSPDGRELAKQVSPGGNPGFSLEMMNTKRQSINQSFLINLFQVLVESGSDRKTATEVMQLVQEKGALLGPIGGRLRTEFLGNIIDRELDILIHAGAVDERDVPDGLIESGGLEVEYDSPLTRAIKAEEGVGIMRTLDFAGQIAQYDPSVMQKFDLGRVIERMTEINGAPPDILFSAADMQAKAQAQAQQNDLQMAVGAAPGIAAAAKDMAQAQQISQQLPVTGASTGVI